MVVKIILGLYELAMVIELIRLFKFENAAGLAAIISRPILGLIETKMFWGLIIWLVEIVCGVLAMVYIFN